MSATSREPTGSPARARAREWVAFLLGVLVGIVVYAALRGDVIPEHPAFEHAAGTDAPGSGAIPDEGGRPR